MVHLRRVTKPKPSAIFRATRLRRLRRQHTHSRDHERHAGTWTVNPRRARQHWQFRGRKRRVARLNTNPRRACHRGQSEARKRRGAKPTTSGGRPHRSGQSGERKLQGPKLNTHTKRRRANRSSRFGKATRGGASGDGDPRARTKVCQIAEKLARSSTRARFPRTTSLQFHHAALTQRHAPIHARCEIQVVRGDDRGEA